MKHLIGIILSVCLLYSCSDDSGYTIKGTVEGADGQTVYLQQIQNFEPVVTDSATIKKGKFEFKGTVTVPDFSILNVGNNAPLQFFIENSKINISVNKDSINASKVTGSKENDIFSEFNSGMEVFGHRIKPLNEEYMSMKIMEANDTIKEKSILDQMDQIRKERNDYMFDFVQKHPNTVVSAFIITNMLSRYISPDQLEPVINSFDDTYSQSQWVTLMKDNLATFKRTQIGQMFTDITLQSPEDQPVSLSNYAGKGKYVLMDFWASWCRPCRIANPHIVKLYDKYKNKGFEIVGISLDRNKDEWTEAIAADDLKWPHMSDLKFWQSEAAKLYSVNSIPYTILLDKEGKILEKGLHAGDLEKKLAELLD
ncbi:MAG: AhpC/TSA family protein [Bacteroidales bacterium]|jgi:thiol-disulfide isomerase/thioredoxin|nr:AhpC/TSA family protein [Bacteroidales bacterium]